jgi:hypothetical protein
VYFYNKNKSEQQQKLQYRPSNRRLSEKLVPAFEERRQSCKYAEKNYTKPDLRIVIG